MTETTDEPRHDRGLSDFVSYGVVLAAGAFGLSWVFLGGFYNGFGLTPAEVGVGYEDAVVTMVVFASTLGTIGALVTVCLMAATAMRDGPTWRRVVAITLVTAAAVAIVGAMNDSIGPPVRWIVFSLFVTAAALVSIATWGLRRPRHIVFIAVSAYLLWLPYVRQLGSSLGEFVPAGLDDPRASLVPRWPTLVCAVPTTSDSRLPIQEEEPEPWLYFGSIDGMVILVTAGTGNRSLIRVPTESVALAGLGDASRSGDRDSLDCPTTTVSRAESIG